MVARTEITVGERIIGDGHPTFIIAEVGINHNGEMAVAKKLVDAAKEAGADAVKFQTYLTEKRVKKDAPIFGILKQCELSPDETRELHAYCQKQGVVFFSTPFDEESVALLHELEVPLFKIASFDIVNKELLRQVTKRKTPVIMSRGMASLEEIRAATTILKEENVPFALLHCVSSYPTKEEDANLAIIHTLREEFAVPIGYSDHTLGIEAPTLSVAAGACIIEKHFTLDKTMDGPDHQMSCEPKDLKALVARVREIESVAGEGTVRLLDCEKPITQYRRST